MSLLLLLRSQGSPLPVLLDGTAEYIEGEGTQPVVLVTVHFYNPDEETYQPQLVETGTVTLVHNGSTDIQTLSFDKRFGNSDGSVYFYFMHPPSSKNLSVRIEAYLRSQLPNRGIQTVNLSRTFTVTRFNEHAIPLASQIDTGSDANGELRSQKRIEEELL